jgi:ATP/maltotriose-dependent transcriptional regulator MalT
MVEEGVTRGLLRVSEGSLSFRHELARLAVESTVPESRARELHQRLLSALTERGADLSLLVHHAALARDAEAVLQFAPRAARQAATLGAHREAAAHFAAALRHAAQLPVAERGALYEGHAWECNLTNQVRTAIESCSRALALYRELGDRVAQARVLRVLARLHWQFGDNAEATRHAGEAVTTLEVLPPSRDLAMAYSTRSMLAMLAGRVEEALDYGNRALALGREFGDIESQVHSLNNIGSALLGSNDETGFGPVEQSLALALEHRLHEAAGRAYTNLMTCSVLRLDLTRAERVLREGLAFCEEREIYTHMYYLRAYGARLEFLLGRWASAAALATELLESGALTPIQRIPTLLTLGLIRARRGDPGAEASLDEAMQLATPTRELQRIGRVAAGRAEVAWYRGDLETVEREVEVGLKLAEGHREPWIRGELAYWQSRARPERAPPANISEPYRLMIEGDWRGAAEIWKKFRMPYEAALALAHGNEDALRESLEILETLGSGPLAHVVKHRLREQGARGIPRGPRASTRGNPAGLTSREVEVLKLVVQGHTNAQVARRLHLSSKTIDHHVSSILGKLEVRSRTEAVAAAFGLGIVKSS